ncbi:hypothetical protein Ancab_029541 [Ancistrocladus abbreviatus]
MEESEKRRERLRALCMEATQAEVSDDPRSHVVPGALSNPLLEASDVQYSTASPRFYFYTDPMAAFSSNKQRRNHGNQNPQDCSTPYATGGGPMVKFPPSASGPRNSEMTPSYVHQCQMSDQRMHQARAYHNSGPTRSPVTMVSPYPMHQGMTPGVWNQLGGASSHYSMYSPGVAKSCSPGFQWRP